MSNESSKTKQLRDSSFINKYLVGKILDIGGGNDHIVDYAEVFDLADGNAQHITKYKTKESYDCVYSSHCLEHMVDVPNAISQWWQLVKPNGYMIIVVPDEDLYEQKCWPAIFNTDHKATFRINKKNSWSCVSYDLHKLCQDLPNNYIINIQKHDLNYDYNLQYKKFTKLLRKIYKWQYSKNYVKSLLAKNTYKALYKKYYLNNSKDIGIPIDQTLGQALAQIQIVLQKII